MTIAVLPTLPGQMICASRAQDKVKNSRAVLDIPGQLEPMRKAYFSDYYDNHKEKRKAYLVILIMRNGRLALVNYYYSAYKEIMKASFCE